MERSIDQVKILVESLSTKFTQQEQVMIYIASKLVGTEIVDMGCGQGLPLQFLATQEPERHFLGVDGNSTILQLNAATGLHNVTLEESLLEELIYPPESIDTFIFNRSLHEVYSTGREAALDVLLQNCAAMLKPEGRIIVYENVVENRDLVSFTMLDKGVENLWARFCADYSIHPIRASQEAETVTLPLNDAYEFLTKYREVDWESEMREGHFIYTAEEWNVLFARSGFVPISKQSFPDRQILRTDGVSVHWDIHDFKHVMVYDLPRK